MTYGLFSLVSIKTLLTDRLVLAILGTIDLGSSADLTL